MGSIQYFGDFSEGVFDGEGVLYSEEGQILFQGIFSNHACFSGSGTFYDKEERLLYQGEIVNGLYHGEGRLYQNGKILYKGSFMDGLYHGQGILYFLDAGIQEQIAYSGTFFFGLYHGEGSLYDAAGTLLHSGSFMDGKPVILPEKEAEPAGELTEEPGAELAEEAAGELTEEPGAELAEEAAGELTEEQKTESETEMEQISMNGGSL